MVEQSILDSTVADERTLELEDSDECEEMVEEMNIEWAELYMYVQLFRSEMLKIKNMIP